MLETFFYFFVAFSTLVILFLLRCVFVLGKKNSLLSAQNIDLSLKINRELEENLDLATSDQLLKELRTRQGTPYILLLPTKEKDYNGITIESHCINPVSCFALLHLAKAIAVQNFKNNGIDPPKLPPLGEYFS